MERRRCVNISASNLVLSKNWTQTKVVDGMMAMSLAVVDPIQGKSTTVGLRGKTSWFSQFLSLSQPANVAPCGLKSRSSQHLAENNGITMVKVLEAKKAICQCRYDKPKFKSKVRKNWLIINLLKTKYVYKVIRGGSWNEHVNRS